MKRGRASEPARRGFTLVELLVVIAIITILMSLLLAAVMRSVIKTQEVQARNEISQLSQAIESFKVKFKVEQPPSRLILANSMAGYLKANGTPIDALHGDSWNYLNRVFPRIDWTGTHGAINWGGKNGEILQGQQCLVFFLGGIPSGGACTGFSTNPANPTAPGGDRITLYDFPVNRLAPGPGNSRYLVFLDPYKKQPYAYFSSYKTANGYNRYATAPFAIAKSDCPALNVAPYAEGWNSGMPTNYLNPNSYQIISAGRDKTFGTGTVTSGATWSPKTPGSFTSPPGSDDMANFHDRFLGIPAN